VRDVAGANGSPCDTVTPVNVLDPYFYRGSCARCTPEAAPVGRRFCLQRALWRLRRSICD
jgi:hypothetical protein